MPRSRSIARWGCCLWIALTLFTIRAEEGRAEEGDARSQAAALHQHGLELYEAGSYAEAAQAFEAAQALAPAPSNLFNQARCYEQLGDLARAIAAIEQFLASDLEPERRERGETELVRLRAAAGGNGAPSDQAEIDLVVVSEPAGADVLVDGRPQAQRTPAVVRVQPGTRMVEVRLEGYQPAREEVEVEAGRAARVELTMEVAQGGTQGGPEAPQDARRLALTGAVQLGAGGVYPALNPHNIDFAAIVVLDLSGGLDLGTARHWRRVTYRPVRLELFFGFEAGVPADGTLLAAGGGGRISLALFRLPLRIEGEVGVNWGGIKLRGADDFTSDLLVAFGFPSVYFQPLPWLEAGIRTRIEMYVPLGSDEFALNVGFDCLVRFRI